MAELISEGFPAPKVKLSQVFTAGECQPVGRQQSARPHHVMDPLPLSPPPRPPVTSSEHLLFPLHLYLHLKPSTSITQKC